MEDFLNPTNKRPSSEYNKNRPTINSIEIEVNLN